MCGSSKKTRKKAKCVEPQKIFSKCVEAQFADKKKADCCTFSK